MSELVVVDQAAVVRVGGAEVPAFFVPTREAMDGFLEFFAGQISNDNTRRAYGRAAREFAGWCEAKVGIGELRQVVPVHVATYIKMLEKTRGLSVPSIKLHLAGLRHLFDWMVVKQVVPFNPASSVRAPKHSVKKGKTPVLAPEDARAVFEACDTETLVGLRDRALMALLFYSFARVGAALSMRVEDVHFVGKRAWVRLHEKGGKEHDMPCHHNLQQYLEDYIERAGLAEQGKAWLFQTMPGRSGTLSGEPIDQSSVYRMIGRYLARAKVKTKAGCHSWRATGITQYLKSPGSRLEVAQDMANHADMRTTRLYDRRTEELTLDEVERISL